jgi:hypothetical protein
MMNSAIPQPAGGVFRSLSGFFLPFFSESVHKLQALKGTGFSPSVQS